MSWDFTADDLRKEIKELRERLAVQGIKLGEQETRLLQNDQELRATKENYADVLSKLRKEADRSLELENALKRRTEELRNEKNARENVEESLRTAKQQQEREAASAREAHHYLSRTATESDHHRVQVERLHADKSKLEAQVRELQIELQRQQTAPPPPPSKKPARPRASSLTQLNKVAMLERDIEQLRASASASEIDMKVMREKLSKVQEELAHAENEKAVLEKKVKRQEEEIKGILSDKSELQTELDFYREKNASHSREDDLMTRLEEEEAKVALLERELAKASTSSVTQRSIDRLQAQLSREISLRESMESREVELVQEREDALNEVDNLSRSLHDMTTSISNSNARINELQAHCRSLENQLSKFSSRVPSDAMDVDEQSNTELICHVSRLRTERDELRGHLDFVQAETRFKIEALEKRLLSGSTERQAREHRLPETGLSVGLDEGRRQLHKFHQATAALFVVIQRLDSQNNYLAGQLFGVDGGESLGQVIESLQMRLRDKAEEVDRLTLDYRVALASQDQQLTEMKLRVSDASDALCQEQKMRSQLEAQARQLEVDLGTTKQELADAMEHCERLEARQSMNASSDAIIQSLKNEIEELRARVLRRTEQIGLQQHDIKRLETNMRLTDERLEEVLGELEMAETAKTAMLDDCTTAREERDQAKRALARSEAEAEQLSAQVQVLEREARDLRLSAVRTADLEKEIQALVAEQSNLSDGINERDARIKHLLQNVAALEEALRSIEERIAVLSTERDALQEDRRGSLEDLQKRMQSENKAMQEQLERYSEEVMALKQAATNANEALEAKSGECRDALNEIEELRSRLDTERESMQTNATNDSIFASELEGARTTLHETKRALLEKEEELKRQTDDLRRLADEFEREKAHQEALNNALDEKDKELGASCAELKRLASEHDAQQREVSVILGTKEVQLKELNEKFANLETDKADLLERLAAFERETEKGISDSSSFQSILEEERRSSDEKIRRLEADLASLNDEMEALQKDLQREVDGRRQDAIAYQDALQTALSRQEALSATESELRGSIQQYQQQLDELRENLMTLQDENTTLQSEIDNLSGVCRRADLKAQSAEKDLASSRRDLSELREEMSRLREALSKSEKSGKSAEMNLLLISQQHENTISSLRRQLKEHEKGAERIQKLQQIVGETKEQISELESALKAKCAEIEENDDKFIQLLKEKKKLTTKVESLMKKNNNLQNKLSSALAGTSKAPVPDSFERQSTPVTSVEDAPATKLNEVTRSEAPVQPKPRLSERPAPSQIESAKETRRVSGSKRRRDSTPPLEGISSTTMIGKKRPFPDDSDAGRPPVEARFADMIKEDAGSSSAAPVASSSMTHVAPLSPPTEFTVTSTPRQRRAAPRSGFTPVRGHAAALRPTLSQPSPIRRNGTRALQAAAAISDITNSPPRSRRALATGLESEEPSVQKPAGKGWLGKIRSSANPLPRSRQQYKTEGQ